MIQRLHVVGLVATTSVLLVCFVVVTQSSGSPVSNVRSRLGRRIQQLGPIRLWNQGRAFLWRASVDLETSRAFSCEESNLPRNCNLHHHVLSTANTDDLRSLTQRVFSVYPYWLCQGRVTLGILRAVPVDDGSAVEIRVRFCGVNILRFGRPHGSQTSRQGDGDRTTATWTWSFPLQSGFMLAPGVKPDSGGNLSFQLVSSSTKGDTHDDQGCSYRLKTEIIDYAPRVVGVSGSLLRSRLYLGTQSLIHATVMWKFHSWCRSLDSRRIAAMDDNFYQ